jgi:hypothetical protein
VIKKLNIENEVESDEKPVYAIGVFVFSGRMFVECVFYSKRMPQAWLSPLNKSGKNQRISYASSTYGCG